MEIENKKKKKRLRFKGIIVIILIIYLAISSIYYIINKPVRRIEITGNNYLKIEGGVGKININFIKEKKTVIISVYSL